jgi:hypothetical protein
LPRQSLLVLGGLRTGGEHRAEIVSHRLGSDLTEARMAATGLPSGLCLEPMQLDELRR